MSVEQPSTSLSDKGLEDRGSISSAPSNVSMRSDASMGQPVNFNEGQPRGLEDRGSISSAPSNVSMRSDASMGQPVNFNEGQPRRLVHPASSNVSMKSNASMGQPVNFSGRELGWEGRGSNSSAPSNVSMKSDASMGQPVNFSEKESGGLEDRGSISSAPSDVSMRSDASMGQPVNFNEGRPSLLERQRPASSTSISMSEDDPLDFMAELGPTQSSSASMETEQFEDDHSKEDFKKKTKQIKADLQKKIKNQYEEELKKCETDTELYKIKDKNGKKEQKQTYKDIWTKEVRIVLMTGVPGVGKTVQTRRFMVEWAKGKSNKDIDFIVSLNFRDLSGKEKVQSMKDLLCHSLSDSEHSGDFRYDRCKVAFVLDSLEECKLPLDFTNNKDLTDIEEPASMDVLLTNLIKGNLLPSALIWIISQPSGVEKIPPAYIQKVTECREDFKHKTKQIKADLQKKIKSQYEEELKKCETDTELYKIKDENGKKDEKQTYKELFKKSWTKEVRIVLMTGVPGVGKTVQTRRFMVEWAKGESNKDIDFIVSLHFRDLLREEKVQSMKDLLCHSLSDSKRSGDFRYDRCKVAFVLDGLEECKLPLDFTNNKDLTDIEEPASMDVLLTNLIKGNLLPSALIWIISQPSGVEKIPPTYIQKVTECRESLKRQEKLISALRERYLKENSKDEDINHPNQKNTEHIVREDEGDEVNDKEKNGGTKVKTVKRVNGVSDIFKEESTRTVLTVGEAGIGKSFHVQKFIKEWAKNDRKNILSVIFSFFHTKQGEVIFPLDLFKIGLIREKKLSLVGLLNHFFMETKKFVISNYEQLKVFFILDGLDAYKPPLDFDNNKTLTDITEPASVDSLLTNLIKGTLFPSARLWITSRYKLPVKCVDRTTEIRLKPDVASQNKIKIQLKEQFTHVSEGIDKQKTSALLNEIYTDLYIVEGDKGEVNDQHETRQIQDAKFKPATQETAIKYCDIFKPASGDNKPIRTVLTIGVAGIGKSFATMKYILDWAEGMANGDIFYVFPLSFRELNLRKDKEHSLEELLNMFFPGMKTSEITDYDKYKILIVLDGFDEYRLDLDNLDDLESNNCTDVREPTSVDVMLSNLIRGRLLSKAQIWITSRPAASNRIPASDIDRVTEVRGFNDEQKEEYFRRRFNDKGLAETILSHVKKSRSLYIMCHIPVFCWITSKVLEDLVIRNQEEMPKTLTDMYIHFLLLQCRQANVKYAGGETGESSDTDSCWNNGNQETIKSLGKLAFDGLEEGNLLFTEEHVEKLCVDITAAAVFSGIFTQIKREGCGVYQQKLFCFVHLSIQEFLAAFYVFCTFNNSGENLLTKSASAVADIPAFDFYKAAVDKALDSKNGDWDLFLRFLLGLSLETNQYLLGGLLRKTENMKESNKATIEYIKEKIREDNGDADKNLNLFHCLNELNDHSLVEEVKKYLQSETLTFENFSASQWSALTFVLLTSDQDLDVFDLNKYMKSEKVLLGMLPVVKVSKTALMSWCGLSEESCKGLSSSVLSSVSSNLTMLDLSHNDLLDSGVQKIADGLKSLHCKLETLKMSGCQVTKDGCSFLASALRSNMACPLKHLDLSYNHPGTNGMTELSAIAEDPNTSLQTVCFDHDGEHRLKPGLKKYCADMKIDENTASSRLILSEGNRTVRTVKKCEKRVERPENLARFKRTQVLCEEAQKGLCYWEVEWKGEVGIGVAYKGVGKGWSRSGGIGCNENSWSLLCSKTKYIAIHGDKQTIIKRPKVNDQVPHCEKIGLFLDWEGGTLNYYSVTSGERSLIHSFHAKFREPVLPAFWFKRGCVTLIDCASL